VHVKLVGRFLALLMFFPPISGSSVRQDGFARLPLTLSFPRRACPACTEPVEVSEVERAGIQYPLPLDYGSRPE
jgi:hypothetical protein